LIEKKQNSPEKSRTIHDASKRVMNRPGFAGAKLGAQLSAQANTAGRVLRRNHATIDLL
jgi:hypothetical protein